MSSGPLPPLQWQAAERSGTPVSVMVKGLVLTSHVFTVPLDYRGQLPGTIDLFVREVSLPPTPFANPPPRKAPPVPSSNNHHSQSPSPSPPPQASSTNNLPSNPSNTSTPYILYLQGGPGHESPRPTESGGFIRKLLSEYRVLLLDQRGTGLSHALSPQVLSEIPKSHRLSYLQCFRADSIVRDCELIRRALLGTTTPWSILGQSFGGFCAITYLSHFPHHLREVYITGGLPPLTLGCSAATVYRRLLLRVIRQNDLYYDAFPADEPLLRDIVRYIHAQPHRRLPLPSGSVLSVRGLQAIGLGLLGFAGGFARLHFMLERAWEAHHVTGERRLSAYFLKAVDNCLNLDTNPLYALLHEAIYCNGPGEASNWAAHRVLTSDFSHEFDAVAAAEQGRRVYLTGEMVFPFMLDEIAALRPLKALANEIATCTEWGELYREQVLASCSTSVAAAIYLNDMYVDYDLSTQTAAKVRGLKAWVTNEYMHSGLREDGQTVLSRLAAMMRGKDSLEN